MKSKAHISLISSMLIFGTVGLFVKFIPLSSSAIAFFRGIIGMLFLLVVCAASKTELFPKTMRKRIPLLCLSGVFLGLNWMFLFESYRYTTVANGTLYYYLAPTIVILLSPLFFKEKLTALKIICAVISLCGMVLVSGMDIGREGNSLGLIFGVTAASLYAAIMILNKKMGDVPAYPKTVIQLVSSSVVMFIYTMLSSGMDFSGFDVKAVIFLVLVGVVHTGVAYVLYFGSVGKLNAQSAAMLSYIDPITAIAASALILRESMGILEILGAILILSAAFVSEVLGDRKKQTK